ncbi:pseudaminic acid synthase [Labilibaculum euxinus]
MKINQFNLTENKTFVIAELSANHNNDIELAKDTIRAMKESGADCVKLQTYTAESLSIDVDNEYFGPRGNGLWKGWRPYDLYKNAAMPWEWQPELIELAESLGMICFSSPFDSKAVDFLEGLDTPAFKIASFEIHDLPLIKYAASKGKPMIISTGIATLEDISNAVKACKEVGNDQIALLKCTSAYPAPFNEINLRTIPNMKETFDCVVGLSDHTLGSVAPLGAVALGAKIIEKHFILDRSLGGVDSSFSMEPKEFKEMVDGIRNLEEALGTVTYDLTEKAADSRTRGRSIFSVQDIKEGEIFTMENVRSVRPAAGLAPKYLDNIIGTVATKDIKKGTPLNWKDVGR